MRKIICFIMMGILAVFFSGCDLNPQPMKDQLENKENNAPDNMQRIEPTLSVYMHETGETKQMKLEEYLAGVVAGEMKNDWQIEALAAQAIIARTFTLQAFEKGDLTKEGTNASTDIKEFQAYNASAINDNVRQAVQMTRGKIATYQSIPIMGWFHASAGGQTAMAKEGLEYKNEEPPFIQSVASPDDMAPDDVRSWTAKFPVSDVIKKLEELGKSVTTISSVAIGNKGVSGRATTILFNGNVEVSAPKLRLALGSTTLKSMLLDSVELSGNEVIFKGTGYGHGVGMSQWGAQKMATDGKTADEIVKYYFKDIKIEKRWE